MGNAWNVIRILWVFFWNVRNDDLILGRFRRHNRNHWRTESADSLDRSVRIFGYGLMYIEIRRVKGVNVVSRGRHCGGGHELDNGISKGLTIRIFSLGFEGFQVNGSGSGFGRWLWLVHRFWFGEGSGRCGLVNGPGGFQNGLELGVNDLVLGFLRFVGNVLRYWGRWWIIRFWKTNQALLLANYLINYSKLITFHRIRRLRAGDWFPIAIHDIGHVVHHASHHPEKQRLREYKRNCCGKNHWAYLWPRLWPCCTIELKPLPRESANPLIMVGRACKSTKPSRLALIVGDPVIRILSMAHCAVQYVL